MTALPAAPLRVFLVDDEAPARARLRTLLGDCAAPAAQVVGEAADAAEASAWLAHGQCDLVLLDVAMPGRDGLSLAAELRGDRRDGARSPPRPAGAGPAIVFVTAYADHAVRAFELDAVDYLTKPVRRERLQATLLRVAERRVAGPAVTAVDAPTASSPLAVGDSPVIVVQDRGRIHRVPVAEVLYLQAELKYLTLRTADRRHVLAGTLGEYEQRLGDAFLRIHRSALVARHAVRTLDRAELSADADEGGEGADGWSVRLVGVDDTLPVSRRQLAAVRAALTARR